MKYYELMSLHNGLCKLTGTYCSPFRKAIVQNKFAVDVWVSDVVQRVDNINWEIVKLSNDKNNGVDGGLKASIESLRREKKEIHEAEYDVDLLLIDDKDVPLIEQKVYELIQAMIKK